MTQTNQFHSRIDLKFANVSLATTITAIQGRSCKTTECIDPSQGVLFLMNNEFKSPFIRL